MGTCWSNFNKSKRSDFLLFFGGDQDAGIIVSLISGGVMQNVLTRKNMSLEGFHVILNLFPPNHMFYTILNLVIS